MFGLGMPELLIFIGFPLFIWISIKLYKSSFRQIKKVDFRDLVRRLLLSDPAETELQEEWIQEKYSDFGRLCSQDEVNRLYAACRSQRAVDQDLISPERYSQAIAQSRCPFCEASQLQKIDTHVPRVVTHFCVNIYRATVCTHCCRVFKIEDVGMGGLS